MFSVSESEAASIRVSYELGGEQAAVVELRRLFPGLPDNENARRWACTIAGWTTLPAVASAPKRARRRAV